MHKAWRIRSPARGQRLRARGIGATRTEVDAHHGIELGALDSSGWHRHVEHLRIQFVDTGRAPFGNYQRLALFDGQNLAILSPHQGKRRHDDAWRLGREWRVDGSDPPRRSVATSPTTKGAFRT